MDQAKLLWRERQSDSPLIESVWASSTLAPTSRAVIADPCISIALVKSGKRAEVVVMGPKTKPRQQFLPANHTSTAVRLKPGVFLKSFPTYELTNTSVTIPIDSKARFSLWGERFQFPDFDHAEQLVEELYTTGYLGFEPLQNIGGQSRRTYSRQTRRTAGLSPYTLHQLQRMHQALRLCKQGVAAIDVATELAFVDQAHLINASRRFLGYTPRQFSHLPQSP